MSSINFDSLIAEFELRRYIYSYNYLPLLTSNNSFKIAEIEFVSYSNGLLRLFLAVDLFRNDGAWLRNEINVDYCKTLLNIMYPHSYVRVVRPVLMTDFDLEDIVDSFGWSITRPICGESDIQIHY